MKMMNTRIGKAISSASLCRERSCVGVGVDNGAWGVVLIPRPVVVVVGLVVTTVDDEDVKMSAVELKLDNEVVLRDVGIGLYIRTSVLISYPTKLYHVWLPDTPQYRRLGRERYDRKRRPSRHGRCSLDQKGLGARFDESRRQGHVAARRNHGQTEGGDSDERCRIRPMNGDRVSAGGKSLRYLFWCGVSTCFVVSSTGHVVGSKRFERG